LCFGLIVSCAAPRLQRGANGFEFVTMSVFSFYTASKKASETRNQQPLVTNEGQYRASKGKGFEGIVGQVKILIPEIFNFNQINPKKQFLSFIADP